MPVTPDHFLQMLTTALASYINGPPIRKAYLDTLQGSKRVLGLKQLFDRCMDSCAEDGTDDEIYKFAHVRDICGNGPGEVLRDMIVKYLRNEISERKFEELKGRLQTIFDNFDYERRSRQLAAAEEYDAAINEIEHAEAKNEYDQKLDEMVWYARKNKVKKREILKTKLRLRTDAVFKAKYDEMMRHKEERKRAKAIRKAKR